MNRILTSAAALIGLTALGACEMAMPTTEAEKPEVPAAVVAALPPGVPSDLVFLASDGCYGVAIEETTPKTGYPLHDRNGDRVCDPEAQAAAATVAVSFPSESTGG